MFGRKLWTCIFTVGFGPKLLPITVNAIILGNKYHVCCALARSFLRLLSLVVHAMPKLLFHLSMQSLAPLTMAAMFNVAQLCKSFFRRSNIKLSIQHRMLKLVIAVFGNDSEVR
jgi:hypothetical protein